MAKIRQVTDILDEVDEGDDENYDGNDAFDVNTLPRSVSTYDNRLTSTRSIITMPFG